jgi:hypothetical protein
VVEVTGLTVVIETAEGGGKRFDEAEVIEATEVRVDSKVVQRQSAAFLSPDDARLHPIR